MAAADRPRRYKEFATPALHRRFISAATVLLVLCWIEAWIMSASKFSFLSIFPLSATGMRSVLLCIPCLAVCMVRLTNMHIGARTTVSPAETFYGKVNSLGAATGTLMVLIWYVGSGWFFGEVYIWSSSLDDGLGWIDAGRADERPRLNENPIFLRSVLVILAITQAVTHLVRDYDRIDVPTQESTPKEQNTPAAKTTDPPYIRGLPKLSQSVQELYARSGTIARRVFNLMIFSFVLLTLPSYYLLLRYVLWRWYYALGRSFFSQLSYSAPPSGLVNVGFLAWQCASASLLLGLLWEASNAVFDIYIAQPPTRNGQPWTSEVRDARGVLVQQSRDPNGSLISGLKSKRNVPRTFAFWELFLICTQFEDRRKTIYTEVDRKDGPTWDIVYECCMGEIEAVKTRITSRNAPAQFLDKQQQLALQKQHQQQLIPSVQDAPLGLPKIADQPVKTDPGVFVKGKPDFARAIGNVAKSYGQSPGAYNQISPQVKKTIEWGANTVLSKDQQAVLSRQHLQNEVGKWRADVLKSPLGEPFRQTFARRAIAVVFGVPYSKRATIVHAAKALTKLVVCSLKEDAYGQVSKDIPKIIRLFTEVIRETEKFIQSLQPSYTDVNFTIQDRDVGEVRETMDVLKSGLEEIVLAFGEYAGTLGLSKKEIREAKEAAARTNKPDMAEVLR